MFYWALLALRVGGQDALDQAGTSGEFNTPPLIEAGKMISDLVDANVFQEGFLGMTDGEPTGAAALVANDKAGMIRAVAGKVRRWPPWPRILAR